MYKSSLLFIPLIFALAACGAPDKDVPGPMVCERQPGPEPECHDDMNQDKTRGAPRVKIHAPTLKVTPACVRAIRGAEIVVSLTPKPNNEIGSARIFPKDDNTWPVGRNDPDKDEIRIEVPLDQPLGYYGYGFEVKGKCIDPRIHVEP